MKPATIFIGVALFVSLMFVAPAWASLNASHSVVPTSATSAQSSSELANLERMSSGTSMQATQSDSPDIQLVGHVGGPIKAVALQGQYAYVGIGPRLVILDVSTPITMTQVGQTSVLPDIVMGVAVSGTLAYVADGAGGLRIINVSNPAAPTEVGFYTTLDPIGFPRADGVAVAGGYAYTIWGRCYNPPGQSCSARLWVLDVSNPAAPTQVGMFETGATAFKDIVVSGGYAYLAGSTYEYSSPPALDEGLWIVSIATPSAPTQVGYLPLPGARDLAVANGYAYVAGTDGLSIANVSNPAQPVQAGALATTGEAESVAVVANHAYVIDGGTWNGSQYAGGKLHVIDISKPKALTEVGSLSATGYTRGIAAAGSTVYYIARDNLSLRAVDVSKPSTPAEIGIFRTGAMGNAVATAGNFAYVAAGTKGLHVVDVSTPAALHEVSSIDTPGSVVDVAVVGDTAYVADESGGLRVINVSNPVSPTETGFYTSTWSAQELVVNGSYAYIATGSNGLRVLNIADPAHPTEVGFVAAWGSEIAAWGDYVFVGGPGTLYVLDVSNSAAPVVMGSIQMDFGFFAFAQYDLAAAANYVYLLRGTDDPYGGKGGSFKIVDISNPVSPTIANDLYWLGPVLPGGIAAVSGMVYVADDSQVCLINVSTPAAPVAVGCRSTPDAGFGAQVVGQNIYAVGQGGLYLLREGFSIAGQVLQANGLPFTSADVTISASGGATMTTDATGVYTLGNLLHGSYVFTATVPGWMVWPVTRTATIPPDVIGQNFTVLPQPVSATLTTLGTVSLPARLAYTDTQGLVTQLDLPTGAVSQTTTLILTPTVEASTPGFAFAGHAFELAASQNGQPLPGFTFNFPVTVTLRYSDDDVRVITDEDQLALWWWTGTGWMDAAQTCQPASAYSRDVAGNSLSVSICHLSRFGLFGPTHQLYLPNVMRSSP